MIDNPFNKTNPIPYAYLIGKSYYIESISVDNKIDIPHFEIEKSANTNKIKANFDFYYRKNSLNRENLVISDDF